MVKLFGHGGLRLMLLSLLEDGPKHGYELIVALEERFMGVYRPSSGTVYPRLAALEEEGLIMSEESDGKRVYALTDAGRALLERRRHDVEETVATATNAVRAAMDELRDTFTWMGNDLRSAADDLRRQAGHVGDRATDEAGRVRSDVDHFVAEMAAMAGEAAQQVRRHLPDEDQRARLGAAFDAAKRAFLETMGQDGTR